MCHDLWTVLFRGPFRTCGWAVLDLAIGRFEHIKNLWAVLVGPFWFMGRFGIDPLRALVLVQLSSLLTRMTPFQYSQLTISSTTCLQTTPRCMITVQFPMFPTSSVDSVLALMTAKSYASHRLQLNPSKTEFIWFGTRSTLSKIPLQYHSLTVCNSSVHCCDLGVYLDSAGAR